MSAPALAVVPARRPSLVDLLEDAQAIIDTLDGIEEADEEAREALGDQLITNITATRSKVDGLAQVLAAFGSAEAAAKAEAARLKARAEYFARQIERLEGYILRALDMWNMPALEGHTATLKRRQNPPSVVIEDPEEIPGDYWRSLPMPADVPDKTLIKAALARDPESVPGCRLQRTFRLEVR